MFTLQDLTVYDAFARARNAYPDNDALTYLDEKWTYAELDRSVNAFAKRFFNIGIKPGMHVGLWCDNTPSFVFSVLALSKMGAVLVLFNTSLHRVEMQKLIAHTDTELLLVGDGYKDIDFRKEAKGLKEKVECLKSVIYIGESRDSKDLPDLFNFAPGPELLLDKMHDSVNAHDDGYILFTSGTTDVPRAVLGSHIARANMGLLQGKDLETKPSDRFCVTMPMFHCFCFSVNFEAALFYGACLCLPKSRHVYDILSTAEKERCTVLSAVPSLFHTIISKYNPDDYNHSSLRAGFIGGGVCSASLFTETEEKLGLTLLSSLGQTEATAAVTTSSLSDSQSIRSSTVGHFIDSVSFRFADNGEICIKGFNVMKGYYNDPYGTSRAIDENGWLHTGDRGYITEEKNLVLTGRVKEIIIRGGENISPLEIESVLDGDKRIACCKAVGVPDVHYGEEAALCVIQNENAGKPITEEQIRRKLRTSLASYKVPKYILFMDEFSKTDSGKIKTLELKRNVIDLLNSSHD